MVSCFDSQMLQHLLQPSTSTLAGGLRVGVTCSIRSIGLQCPLGRTGASRIFRHGAASACGDWWQQDEASVQSYCAMISWPSERTVGTHPGHDWSGERLWRDLVAAGAARAMLRTLHVAG